MSIEHIKKLWMVVRMIEVRPFTREGDLTPYANPPTYSLSENEYGASDVMCTHK